MKKGARVFIATMVATRMPALPCLLRSTMILLLSMLANVVHAESYPDFDWGIDMLNTTFKPDLEASNYQVLSAIYSIPSLYQGKSCIPRLHTHDCKGVSDEMSLSSIAYPQDGILSFDVGFDKDRIEGSPFYDIHSDGVVFDISFCTRVDCYHRNATSFNFYESQYTLTVDPLANFISDAALTRSLDLKNESYSFGTVEAYFCDENGNALPESPELEAGDTVGYCVEDDDTGVYHLYDVATTTIAQYFDEEMHPDLNATRRLAPGVETSETGDVPPNYKGKIKSNPEPLKAMKNDRDDKSRTIPDRLATKNCEKQRGKGATGKGAGKCVMKVQIPSRFYDNIQVPGEAPVLIYGTALLRLGSGSSRHLLSLPVGKGRNERRLQNRGDGFDLAFSLIRREPEKHGQGNGDTDDKHALYIEIAAGAFILFLILLCYFLFCFLRSRSKKKRETPEDTSKIANEGDGCNGKTSSYETDSDLDIEGHSCQIEEGGVVADRCELGKSFERKVPTRSRSADDALLHASSFVHDVKASFEFKLSNSSDLDLEDALSKRLEQYAKKKSTRKAPGRSKSDEQALENMAAEPVWFSDIESCPRRKHKKHNQDKSDPAGLSWYEEQAARPRKSHKKRKAPKRSKSADDQLLAVASLATPLDKPKRSKKKDVFPGSSAESKASPKEPSPESSGTECQVPPPAVVPSKKSDHKSMTATKSSSRSKPSLQQQNSFHNPAA